VKFATREQIQTIHSLGTSRNALKVLGAMKKYLNVDNFKGLNVYHLNKEGRDWIGSTNEVKFSYQIEHYLLRNDLFIHYGCPKSWEIEKKTVFKILGQPEKHIRPDARFQVDGVWNYVEIDRTQSMSENKKRIVEYGELSSVIHQSLGYLPNIIFYTVKPSRKAKIKELCKEAGVNCTVMTPDDIK
jgi:hypothetical protein